MTGYKSKKTAAQDKVTDIDGHVVRDARKPRNPPQRPWVDLTDKEIDVIYEQHHNQYGECESPNFGYERAIEAKLKERNA